MNFTDRIYAIDIDELNIATQHPEIYQIPMIKQAPIKVEAGNFFTVTDNSKKIVKKRSQIILKLRMKMKHKSATYDDYNTVADECNFMSNSRIISEKLRPSLFRGLREQFMEERKEVFELEKVNTETEHKYIIQTVYYIRHVA